MFINCFDRTMAMVINVSIINTSCLKALASKPLTVILNHNIVNIIANIFNIIALSVYIELPACNFTLYMFFSS